MIEGMLHAGQTIRLPYDKSLWRVEHVNECRAFILPLLKRRVDLPDGRTFDAGGRGQNIAPNAFVEIVSDIKRAMEEMALEEAEAELRDLKRQLAEPRPVVIPTLRSGKRDPVKPGGGWYLTEIATPSFKEGTLAEKVWLFIGTHPGLSTADIVAGAKIEGAVAACVSRFHQAGLIVKR